jgi:transposase-like protein
MKTARPKEKRLNTHSVNAGTYRSDGPLSTKNKQKNVYDFILLALPNKKNAPVYFYTVVRPCFASKFHFESFTVSKF